MTVNNQDIVLEKTSTPADTPQLTPLPIEEHNPEYMKLTYDWAYVNPRNVNFLDKEWIVWVLLFLNAGRLKQRYIDLIKPGSSVWQVAHVYGNLVQKAAQKVGPEGIFHLSDVTPIQFEHATQKLSHMSWAKPVLSDASDFDCGIQYDTVCSFFLLHEVPNDVKKSVIANMIKKMKPGGQMIFVDYHNPHVFHPIRYILKLVNTFLEPYAFALWDHEIAHFGLDTEHYHIQKETIFGGVYQIVRVTQK